MQELEVVFEPQPSEALARFVAESVDTFNVGATGLSEWHPANFFLRNLRGEWLGGLLGSVWGGWLQIGHLWVAQAARRHGYGRRLLKQAESYAVERGCFAVAVDTHSFQAPAFYLKQGYEVVGTLVDYPPGHSKFLLRKDLARNSGSG